MALDIMYRWSEVNKMTYLTRLTYVSKMLKHTTTPYMSVYYYVILLDKPRIMCVWYLYDN